MKLPGDPTLPPGCTHADIERRFGDPVLICDECEQRVEELIKVGRRELCIDCVYPHEQDE